MVRWSAVVSLHALLLAETCAVRPAMDVEWPSFLARSDMTSRWSRPSADAAWVEPGPPFSYDKAGFMGNGNLGAMVQATENGSVVLVLGAPTRTTAGCLARSTRWARFCVTWQSSRSVT